MESLPILTNSPLGKSTRSVHIVGYVYWRTNISIINSVDDNVTGAIDFQVCSSIELLYGIE